MNDFEDLILGVGNPLRRDDGIGITVVKKLQELKKAGTSPLSRVVIIDGGTDGLGLMEFLKVYKNVILIDAVEMGLPPGTVKQFTPNEAVFKIKEDSLSTHGFGIAELITLSRELGIIPGITIIGVQPEDSGYGEGLSPAVNQAVDLVCKKVLTLVLPE
ncbi:MAG: hypothetical protein DRP59_05895 [Spirochaetes bacterium]|nr:MAG: hypothetical protein DRP59_05895 [Spirochaetota bacterium]